MQKGSMLTAVLLTAPVLLLDIVKSASEKTCNHYRQFALEKCNFGQPQGDSFRYRCNDEGIIEMDTYADNPYCSGVPVTEVAPIKNNGEEWRCDAPINCDSQAFTLINYEDQSTCDEFKNGYQMHYISDQCIDLGTSNNGLDYSFYASCDDSDKKWGYYVNSNDCNPRWADDEQSEGECGGNSVWLCGDSTDRIECDYLYGHGLDECESVSVIGTKATSQMYYCQNDEIYQRLYNNEDCSGTPSRDGIFTTAGYGTYKCGTGNGNCPTVQVKSNVFSKEGCNRVDYIGTAISNVPVDSCYPASFWGMESTEFTCTDVVLGATQYHSFFCEDGTASAVDGAVDGFGQCVGKGKGLYFDVAECVYNDPPPDSGDDNNDDSSDDPSALCKLFPLWPSCRRRRK